LKTLFLTIHSIITILAILVLFHFQSLQANAICVGGECSFLSSEEYALAFAAEPLLDSIYGNSFLNSMAESAVLQNVNSTLMGGTLITKNRVSLGYSLARSNLRNRFPLIDQTELRALPRFGAAVSPNLVLATNLGNFLDKSGEWRKWNLHLQFFSYYPSEINLLFLNLRNVNVKGRVANFNANLRYFPFANVNQSNSDSNTEKSSDLKSGLSFGFGMFRTEQTVYLNTYDRRPSQISSNGQRRRWIGINDLKYESELYSSTADVRYAYSWNGFTLFGGMGIMNSQGNLRLQAQRIALVSSRFNVNDFESNPTGIQLDLRLKNFYNQTSALGILGIQYKYDDFGLGLELMRSQNSESVNFGIQYYF